MGQKTNPNIFRLGVNKTWKTEFFEKKNAELSLYTFKDLEIKDYIERFLETHGLILHDYKQQYSNSTLNLYISYFITSECTFIKDQAPTVLLTDKTGKKKKVSLRPQIQNQKVDFTNVKLQMEQKNAQEYYLLKKYLKTNNYRTQSKEMLATSNSQITNSLDGVLNDMFKTLSLFLNNTNKINVNFSCLNKDFSFLKTIQTKKFILLQKFRTTPFLKEGLELLFYVICNRNSANLLAKFIALQIKKIKRQKFFLSFLKQSLTVMLNSEISTVKGIKIILKGRLNGVPRAKHTIIVVGDVPVQSISETMDYSQVTVHNANGSYGIKVWVVEK